MDFLKQKEYYISAKQHRGCYNGHYGKIYNTDDDDIRPMNCNKWSCPNCRPRKKYNLFLDTYYNVLNLDLSRHFILTFGGKQYRSTYTWEQSFQIMSSIWNKLKKVIEYHHGPLDYIQFPRSQLDGYCHLHTLIPKYISWNFLEQKRKKLYPELGYLRINKNQDVAQYLHTDFFKDHEYIIPDNQRHFRSSRSIKINKYEKSDEILFFTKELSEEYINAYMRKQYGRQPLELIIQNVTQGEN